MNKKQLPIPITLVIAFLLNTFAFAEAETYRADLDNDGQEEIITAEDKFDTDLKGIVAVSSLDKSKADSFSMPDHLGEIEFIGLNKDGFKQIVAWSYGGAHYTNLSIYGYMDKRLYKIF